MKQLVALLLILAVVVGRVDAQEEARAWFTASSRLLLAGEPFELALNARIPDDTLITSWPEILPPEWPPFEIVSTGELEVEDDAGGGRAYRQNFEVILWLPGEYQTPQVSVFIQNANKDDTRALLVESAFFSVATVLDQNDLLPRPFRPQAALPYVSPLLYAAAAVVVVAALAFSLRWLRGRRARSVPTTLANDQMSAAARNVLAALKKLGALNLPGDQIFPQAADCLRAYTQEMFNSPALDMTTDELIRSLDGRISEPLRGELSHLLDQADLVKFARHQPRADSIQRYLESAGQWVQQVERRMGR